MDIVIPFKNSINNDQELRFVLRSIEKYFPNLGNIFIVGDRPRWQHQNLILYPTPDPFSPTFFKDRNIAYKIHRACLDPRVSSDFVIFHDDNFLQSEFMPGAYYYDRDGFHGAGDYANTEFNTKELLGYQIRNYDLHAPHRVNKNRFLLSVYHREVNWEKPYGYCIKTLYAVMNGIMGVPINDCKLKAAFDYKEAFDLTRGRPFFSISDTAYKPGIIRLLKELYAEKSKYEVYNIS